MLSVLTLKRDPEKADLISPYCKIENLILGDICHLTYLETEQQMSRS